MSRLRENKLSSNLSNQAQTAIEYILLLATATVIVLLAFNGKHIERIYDAADLYFNRTAVGIYGEASACGDQNCEAGIEDDVNKSFCPIDCPGVPIPTIGDCFPPNVMKSGPCTITISYTVKQGTSASGNCSEVGCSGKYKFQCVNGLLTPIFSNECSAPN